MADFAAGIEAKNSAGPSRANTLARLNPEQSTLGEPKVASPLARRQREEETSTEDPARGSADTVGLDGDLDDSGGLPGIVPAEQSSALELDDSVTGDVLSAEQAAEEFGKWMREPTLAEPLLDKLIEVSISGQKGFVPVREMREGYMRQVDHTQGKQWVAAQKREMQTRDANVRNFFEGIRDPGKFVQEFEDRGYEDVLEKAAEMIAERRIQEHEFVLAAQQRVYSRARAKGVEASPEAVFRARQMAEQTIADNRRLQRENRELLKKHEQLSAQRQEQTTQEDQDRRKVSISNQLNQLRPRAFKALGLNDGGVEQSTFLERLNGIISVINWDGQITPDLVRRAAQETQQVIADRARARERLPAQPEQRPASRALGPNRVPGPGGPRTGDGNGRAPAKRMSDFWGEIEKR